MYGLTLTRGAVFVSDVAKNVQKLCTIHNDVDREKNLNIPL